MRLGPLLLTTVLLSGCGSVNEPDEAEPLALTGNGARTPIATASDTLTLLGFGFGNRQGDSRVLVSTSSGTAEAIPVRWTNRFIAVELPGGASSGELLVLAGSGDTLGMLELLVAGETSFDPAGFSWMEGAALPAPAAGSAAAYLHLGGETEPGAVILTGGFDSTAVSPRVLVGSTEASGMVGSWQERGFLLPEPRARHGSAVATRFNSRLDTAAAVAYVAGGIGADSAPAGDVFSLVLDANLGGSSWVGQTPLPLPVGGTAAIVSRGLLFVVGGFGGDSLARPEVFYARVLRNGQLNGWFRGPELPLGTAFGALAASGRHLFYVGGETGRIDGAVPDSAAMAGSIFSLELDPGTGAPAAAGWTEIGVLANAVTRHVAFAVPGGLVVSGGLKWNSESAAESVFAPIEAGVLGVVQDLPGTRLSPDPLVSASSSVTLSTNLAPRIHVFSGLVADSATAEVWWQ